jgi:hypothetical protein
MGMTHSSHFKFSGKRVTLVRNLLSQDETKNVRKRLGHGDMAEAGKAWPGAAALSQLIQLNRWQSCRSATLRLCEKWANFSFLLPFLRVPLTVGFLATVGAGAEVLLQAICSSQAVLTRE